MIDCRFNGFAALAVTGEASMGTSIREIERSGRQSKVISRNAAWKERVFSGRLAVAGMSDIHRSSGKVYCLLHNGYYSGAFGRRERPAQGDPAVFGYELRPGEFPKPLPGAS